MSFRETDVRPVTRRAFLHAGAAAVGAFTAEAGLARPGVMLVVAYPSLGDVAAVADRLTDDAAFRDATRARKRGGAVPYVRYEAALYRAFPGHPRLEVPPAPAAGRPARLFELRTYEAPNASGLRAKVAMFDEEEVRIFRAVGFAPVFFGEAVAGTRLPHLTYMVAFDDMEARAKAWAAFGAHPDWQRIRVRPGWTDPETVSASVNVFLRPTAYSEVR